MKTNTAIQKSRDEFEQRFCTENAHRESIVTYSHCNNPRELSEKFQAHITTSQKDIFSGLIEDLEVLKGNLLLMSKKEIEESEMVGCNRVINQAQDIIRKAMEV